MPAFMTMTWGERKRIREQKLASGQQVPKIIEQREEALRQAELQGGALFGSDDSWCEFRLAMLRIDLDSLYANWLAEALK